MSLGTAIEGTGNINNLGGVQITSPTNGQTLVYNSVTGLWVNSSGGGAVGYQTVEGNGVAVAQETTINFIGGGVTVVDNPGLFRTDVTISSGAPTGYQTIENLGTSVAQETTFNFATTGITAVDNPGASRTDISLASSLVDIAALSPTLNNIIYGNGTHFVEKATVAAQIRYVDPNGSDTTGDGSILFPFASIGHTLTSITDSTSTKPYVVSINPGTYSETGLEVPVWVFLVGSYQQPTKIIDSSGAIKINSASFSAGSERIGFENLNLINSTGITIDFQAIGGAGSNQVYMNNNQIIGPVIMRGRGSDAVTGFDNRFFGTYTSSAMQEVHISGYFANSVTFNTLGVTGVNVGPAFTSMSFYSTATFTSSGAGNTMTPTMVSCPQSGTLTVDQATTTLSADEVSLNAATLSQTNGGLITYLSLAKYEGYTPATSVNWNTVPTVVSTALDDLATTGIYKSQTANKVLASPSGSSGLPSFRTLTSADLPSILFDNVRYIDWANGSDVTGDGSQQRPWKSLQHAYTTIGTPALNFPYTIIMEPGFDSVDSGPITGAPNINLICIGGNVNIPQPLTITGGATNDVMTISNVTFSGSPNSFTWVRNDTTEIDLTLNNVSAFGIVTFEQQGSGVAVTTFEANFCVFVGLSIQAGEIGIFGTFFEGNTLAVADSGVAYFQCLGSYFYNTAITLAGGVNAGFGGCLLDNSGTPISITGTATGSGTPAIFTDASSIPATIAGAYSVSSITGQANYINANYTPVNYTAVSSDVTGNLHGIDNELGVILPSVNVFTGDSGTGGVKGIVPAPPAGSYAAGDFLSAGGSWTFVDQSKPRSPDFAIVSQTAQLVGGGHSENTFVFTHSNGKLYALVSGGGVTGTMEMYDVSDPLIPVRVNSGNYTGSYNITAAVISGSTYAFIPASGASTLIIVNITNPYSWTTTSTTTITGAPGSIYSAVYANGYVYCATQNKGLTVLDAGGGLAGGTLAVPVQSFQEGAVKSFGVAISGNFLYTTQYITSVFGTRQIKSWALTGAGTLAVPSLVQSFQVATAGEALGITISGNTAFVSVIAAGVNSVNLIDITTPSAMANLSQITPSYTFNSPYVGVASGNYLFIPSGSNATNGGAIDMYDITTLSAPFKVATTYTGVANDVFGGIAINGGYIYAGAYGVPAQIGPFYVFSMPNLTPVFGAGVGSTLSLESLTPSTALVSSASNGIISSITTSTELSYVHGVTSSIQAQINAISPFVWNVETTSVALVANNGYIANSGSLLTFTLPATATVGNVYRVAGLGTGGWMIAQNASQLIYFGVDTTTTGTGGSLASTNSKDVVEIVCVVTNTSFLVTSSIGNITIV